MKVRKKKKPVSRHRRIIGALRKMWWYSVERQEALAKARLWNMAPSTWQCASCKQPHQKVVVDHIEPVVNPNEGFQDWNQYIAQLFVTFEKLQVLCKECHGKKTNKENKQRQLKRLNKKQNLTEGSGK